MPDQFICLHSKQCILPVCFRTLESNHCVLQLCFCLRYVNQHTQCPIWLFTWIFWGLTCVTLCNSTMASFCQCQNCTFQDMSNCRNTCWSLWSRCTPCSRADKVNANASGMTCMKYWHSQLGISCNMHL